MKLWRWKSLIAKLLPILAIQMTAGAEFFQVSEISPPQVVLECACDASPGTVVPIEAAGGRVYLTILSRQSGSAYRAVAAPGITDPADVNRLKVGNGGSPATILKSWAGSRVFNNYWTEVKNHYHYRGAEWLVLENGKDLKSGGMPKGMPFLLSLRHPPIDGYMCLLSPEENGKVVVFYPNSRPGSDNRAQVVAETSGNNLTYDRRILGTPTKPAIMNVGPRADQPGSTTFVVLVSTQPRSLAAFLPAGYSGTFVDWQGMPIDPAAVGPGLLDPQAPRKPFRGVDYLPGDSWAISKLTVNVIE